MVALDNKEIEHREMGGWGNLMGNEKERHEEVKKEI